MIANNNENFRKPFMKAKELAGYWGISPKTVANWKRAGLLVFIQVRRVVRFDVAASEKRLRDNQGF